jgi:peptidoglycan/xylan/chitin deacetylase (PgdA/CDA1 family)
LGYLSLTFDDGFLHHYVVARTLHRVGVSASFFVPTGRTPFYEDKGGRLAARPDLLGEMVDMGHEIGSHTHTHRDLTMLSPLEIKLECQRSIEALNTALGSRSRAYGLAYPFGVFNGVVVREVSKAFSYARAGSYSNRWNTVRDPYAIGSFGPSKHFAKIPLRAARNPSCPIVLLFHSEPLPLILSIVRMLRTMNVKIVPLKTSLTKLGILTRGE